MAEGRPWPLHLLPRFLLLLSMAVCCASQARNVEVFFPSNSAPAFPNSPPVPPPPPPPSPPVSSSPPGPPGSPPGKTNVTVTKAVVATAASTFVVSGILFFAAFRYTFKRRKIESYSLGDAKIRRDGNAAGKSPRGGATNPYRASPAGGTLKAVVVDENGLEVLYWRDAGDARRRCNHCKQVIGGQGCDDDRGGRATAVPQKPPDGGRNGKSRQHASPLLQDDSLNSSDRLKEVISVVSEGSGGSESITLAPIVASPPLALPPGRRGSASKPPSPASSSSPRPAIVQHSSSSPPAAHQFSAVAAAAPPVQSSKAPAGPPPPPPPKPPSAAPPPPPPKPPSAAPPPPPPLLPLKGAAPPPPPAPPGKAAAPAPPPPPPGKGGAPPPPPPPVSGPAGKKPSPSPPPPPGLGSRKPPASRPGGQPPPEAPQGPKMKPLHWDKVNTVNTDHSMVWDKIHGGSFRFDDDLMVALFGNVAAGRKSPRGSPTSSSNPHKAMAGSAAAAPAQICLLDPRKSQNIAIVLRSLAVSRAEVLDSLLEGRGISADTLEKLSKLAPTKDEEDTILGFSGNPSSLADAESFLFHLLRAVPSAFSRVDAMLFQANYEPEVLHLKQSLKALELACAEMRKQGLFMRMLEAVLKAGNRMNAGTVRGNAQAFNLSSLRKLSDVKSTDGKTTLLHFVVESVVRSEGKRCVLNRNHSFSRSMSRSASGLSAAMREEKEVEYLTLGLPVVGGLSMEYANVKKAAAVEPEALLGTCASLSARVEKVKRVVSSCGDGNGGFAKEMGEFLERAETELKALTEEQGRVMELVKQTTEYYMLGSSQDRTAHPLQLFIIVKDFVGMVDQACVDIARNLQQKKRKPPPSSGGSGSGGEPPAPEKKAPTRFPNLPPRFLSDNSRSSTSGSDSDSEDDF